MRKKLLFIIVFLAIIGGGIAYLLTTDSAKQSKTYMAGLNSDIQPTETPQQPGKQATQGAYIDYTETVIADTPGVKILFFYAPWCPQCRALETSIKETGVPAGVTIIKTDYDSSQTLRKKYGVTLQTTLVKVDDKGDLLEKFVAYDDPSLGALTKALL